MNTRYSLFLKWNKKVLIIMASFSTCSYRKSPLFKAFFFIDSIKFKTGYTYSVIHSGFAYLFVWLTFKPSLHSRHITHHVPSDWPALFCLVNMNLRPHLKRSSFGYSVNTGYDWAMVPVSYIYLIVPCACLLLYVDAYSFTMLQTFVF